MKHPNDIALIAACLWLLLTEIIDVLTPKWLTGIMIAEALSLPVLFVVLGYAVYYRRARRREMALSQRRRAS